MSRRKQPPIPKHVRDQVDLEIHDFNHRIIKDPDCFYVSRYSGSYLYLDRHNYGPVSPIARLKYQGEMRNWEFAIYKYSKERFDPDEWFFPGVQHIDGTVEGAMKAGLEAYPL